MEFNEKLQQLRKQKGITQHQLAKAIFVSRTAVSKWESGNGYPSIDSLKAIAAYFEITVDELLSSGELLTIAKQKQTNFFDVVFGLLDISVLLLFFFPFLRHSVSGATQSASLLAICGIATYLKSAYFVAVISITLCGFMLLALQNLKSKGWLIVKIKLSLVLNAVLAILFVISLQPYAASFLLLLLAIKVLILIKSK